MQWYYTFLVRQPYLMVLAIAVLCSACIIVSLTTKELPDFSEPTLGFEARGTEIGKRLTAWNNLLQETERSVYLFANPNDLLASSEQRMYDNFSTIARRQKTRRNRKRKDKKRKHKNHKKLPKNKDLNKKIHTIKNRAYENSDNLVSKLSPSEWNGDSGVFRDYEITNETMTIIEQSNGHNDFEYGRNMSFVDEDDHQEKIQIKSSTWRILKQANSPPAPTWNEQLHTNVDGYFCESPTEIFSHFIVERIGPNSTDSLFDLNGMLAMCQLQDQITSVPFYGEHCEKEIMGNCCKPWSLPNYVALLSNKSSCFDLNQDDVDMVQNLLVACFSYFHSLKLSNDCNEHIRCHAPLECTRHNAVFNILHYLTDFNFIKTNDSNIYLKYAMVFVPVTHSTNILPLFHEWEKVHLQNELVQVAAMDLGLENELFNESLLKDGWLVALGGVFVMTCMWLYTTSLFVTGMTCLAVVFALGLAYFIYTLIFEMSFFPYMNLLAVVVIIGIGADDAFIFVKIWQCVLEESFTKSINTANSLSATVDTENTETLKNLMALTLRHAALSMFVTSVTTAGAFYTSYISYITSIKCFGIFAGTAVITNYLLMITWLPASVTIMERFSTSNICGKLHVQILFLKLKKSISKICKVFENFVVNAVINYPLVWVILFAMIGVSSAVIVLYSPGLQLPDNSHFQLFVNTHPFEIYESKLKHEFWFEKSLSALKTFKLPLRFVWGILPIDDGDYVNPYAQGNLYYDNNFNISTKAAQVWLLEFCQRLKEQPFYQLTLGMLLPNCFIENFISSMNRMCIDTMDSTDRTPCCDISIFPYEPYIFDLCLPKTISMLYATPREYFLPGVAGPKFFSSNHDQMASTFSEQQQLKNNNTMLPPPLVKALVIEFESNVSSTTSYHEVKKFVQTVDDWFTEEIRTAPNEMQGGWFTSELKFFDVQDTLSKGTKVAIAVSMVASLVVLLAVTLNVLISLFAVLTVSLTIFTTVAVLILLDWKLNILESIAVSTAIGLAVDYSLHYSIHYRLSPISERDAATQFSLTRIIGPTAMAALTTIVAGVLMLFSTVLPYIQIGIFLVVVTSVSWIYATFFLMSLFKLIGPQYGFMQFSFPKLGKHPTANPIKYYDRKQSQVIAREQLLTPSSSAVGELIHSESHELDSLTSNSLIKIISGNEYLSTSPMGQELVFHQSNEKLPANLTHMIHKTPTINYQFPSAESTTTLNVPADVAVNFK